MTDYNKRTNHNKLHITQSRSLPITRQTYSWRNPYSPQFYPTVGCVWGRKELAQNLRKVVNWKQKWKKSTKMTSSKNIEEAKASWKSPANRETHTKMLRRNKDYFCKLCDNEEVVFFAWNKSSWTSSHVNFLSDLQVLTSKCQQKVQQGAVARTANGKVIPKQEILQSPTN